MKNILPLFFFLLSFAYGNETDVLERAKELNAPVAAVFLGKECVWSKKLDEEVLKKADFQDALQGEAILWQVEDEALLQKYHVSKTPEVLLLDPQGVEFARFEYSALDAQEFADQIVGMIEDFEEVCALATEESSDELFLKELYTKAQKLSDPYFSDLILERGLKMEKGTFFHVESYASLLEKVKIKSPEARKMREDVLKRDPENAFGTPFLVAAAEFHSLASRMKARDKADKAIAPLQDYLARMEKQDVQNAWKAKMMIAEFLFSKNAQAEALKYAKSAYEIAPAAFQQKISDSISMIERSSLIN